MCVHVRACTRVWMINREKGNVGRMAKMWLYQVPSTGCRCGLRFLSGLLINSECVYVCVFVCLRTCPCAPRRRETSSLISPSSTYYTPMLTVFIGTETKKHHKCL